MLDAVMTVKIRLDGSKLLHLFDFGQLRLFFVHVPMIDPREKALIFIVHHAMDFPTEVGQPLQLHHVELVYRDAADFSPRSVLESVIVKEFAAEEQGCCEHTIDSAR
jgi:hypothetical protein